MCISVEGGSVQNSANLHLWDYTGASEQGWELVPENQIIGQIRIFADNDGGTSSWNTSGHAFISIENTVDFSYPIGYFNLEPGYEMTLGTWGNLGFNGIWYNYETMLNTSSSIYLTDDLKINELSTIRQYIITHNSWSEFNNCSSFAVGLWNTASNINLSAGIPNTPTTLKQNILATSGNETGRNIEKLTPIGYFDTSGVFVDKSEDYE